MNAPFHKTLAAGKRLVTLLLMAFAFQTSTSSQTPYFLTVESAPAVGTGGTVYRFYVELPNPGDRLSAVFGDDQSSLLVHAPLGVFNSAFNSGWSAAGINSLFLPAFPDLVDDTYATIGLDGPASIIPGAADPSLVEDGAQPVLSLIHI